VQVVAADDGRYLTSSRTESHRLASAFVKQSDLDGQTMTTVIKDRLGLRDDTPLAPRQIARAVFALDPLCLIHGVFFADTLWPGQPRIARALTGSIEARDVSEAVSGGVKRDSVRHSLADSEGGTAEGYGSVPFHRVEYTAREIEATFVLDLAQLDAYGLPASARDLLEAIALWEVRQLLDSGLRLRTACDFAISDPSQVTLPTSEDLEARVRTDIDGCGALIESPVPLTVTWAGGKKKVAK
jgi:CRISPR-associated protein Csb1